MHGALSKQFEMLGNVPLLKRSKDTNKSEISIFVSAVSLLCRFGNIKKIFHYWERNREMLKISGDNK